MCLKFQLKLAQVACARLELPSPGKSTTTTQEENCILAEHMSDSSNDLITALVFVVAIPPFENDKYLKKKQLYL